MSLRTNHFYRAFLESAPHLALVWTIWLISNLYGSFFPNTVPDSWLQFTDYFFFYAAVLVSFLSCLAVTAGLVRKESFKEAYKTVFSTWYSRT